MERLLTNTMKRRIELLKLLSKHHRWVLSSKLATSLNCSTKTVKTDCEYIQERWPHILSFEFHPQKGIKLHKERSQSIYQIYMEISKDTVSFQLLESIFFKPDQGAEYWERTLYLSNSTMYRATEQINSVLEESGLHLNRAPINFSSDSELRIRFFFETFFFELYSAYNWPYPLPREKLYQIVESLDRDFDLKLSDLLKAQLAHRIAVTIIREQQGFLVSEIEYQQSVNLNDNENWRIFHLYIDKIFEQIDNKQKFPTNLYKDFFYSVFWWIFPWDNEEEKQRFSSIVHDLMKEMQTFFNIPYDEASYFNLLKLFEITYSKHKAYPYKRALFFHRHAMICEEIEANFPNYAKFIAKKLQELESKQNFPWFTIYYEQILHGVTIRWYNLFDSLEQLRTAIIVYVCSHIGIDHTNFIVNILKKHAGKGVQLIPVRNRFEDLKKIDFEKNYNLFVCNFPISYFHSNSVLIIDDLPSFNNIIDLKYLIEQKRSEELYNRTAKYQKILSKVK